MENGTMAKKELAKVVKSDIVGQTDYDDIDFGPGDEVEAHELSIPFFAILQANSPEVEEQTIKGAKAGIIFNTVTKELYPNGIYVLPVKKDYKFIQWIPRSRMGGFAGAHDPGSELVATAIKANGGSVFGNLTTPGANGDDDLVETKFMNIFHFDPKTAMSLGFGILSFSKTKIKPYNDWITSMRLITPKIPDKFRITIGAHIKTVKQTNSFGTFYNYVISPGGSTWKESQMERPRMNDVLLEAKGFQDMLKTGMAKPDFDSTKSDGDDNEAPF